MSTLRNLAIGLVMGLATLATPGHAMPFSASGTGVTVESDVIQVRRVCNAYRCWNTRPRWRPPVVYVQPRVVYRPAYRPAYGGYNRHVRWCLNRYRTYNPATNRYHAGGGVYPACYSPFR